MMQSARQQRRARGRNIGPRRTYALVTGASLALVLGACGWGGEDESAATDGSSAPSETQDGSETDDGSTTLVISHPQEPPNWDFWQTGATAAKVPVLYNVVEPLLEAAKDGSLSPLLAENYEISDDGLTYTFTIREATFHDGSELTSADVVYSLQHSAESPLPKMSGAYEPVESIKALDERTVEIVLSRPSQAFLSHLATAGGAIIPEGSGDSVAEGPIGTGPYVFEDWRPDVEVVLSQFGDYWGELPHFQDVTFRFIAEEASAISALEAGDVDLIATVLGDGVERLEGLEATEEFDLTLASAAPLSYLSLNAKEDVWNDERVRQAVAHAIDREAIVNAAVAGYGEPTCVFVNPPTEPWNSDYCPYPYDPERSRELLADAGAENLTVEFKHLTIAEFPAIMQVVVSQLDEVGITAETEGFELATYLEEVNSEPYAYELTNLTGVKTIDGWTCPGSLTQYCDEEFDQMLADADASLDKDQYVELRRQAIERHADAAYLIPLFTKSIPTVQPSNLEGVKDYRVDGEFDLRHLQWAN